MLPETLCRPTAEVDEELREMVMELCSARVDVNNGMDIFLATPVKGPRPISASIATPLSLEKLKMEGITSRHWCS